MEGFGLPFPRLPKRTISLGPHKPEIVLSCRRMRLSGLRQTIDRCESDRFVTTQDYCFTRCPFMLSLHLCSVAKPSPLYESVSVFQPGVTMLRRKSTCRFFRHAASHVTVSGSKPSPLFWFTTSRLFAEEYMIQDSG